MSSFLDPTAPVSSCRPETIMGVTYDRIGIALIDGGLEYEVLESQIIIDYGHGRSGHPEG